MVLVYLTQRNQIKGLTKTEYEALREMCRYAKNLYNVGMRATSALASRRL